MKLKDKVIVVTGGANGIGRALCHRFAAEGARAVVVADLDIDSATRVAGEIGGLAILTNAAIENDIVRLVHQATNTYGPIDLFCSNAGIAIDGGVEVPDHEWRRIWEINVMAHTYAARAVLPGMIQRGEGYLLQTISAAGLLSQIGSAPYSVTKHAALALAEWLAITYNDAGIRVSALCPQGVRTEMLRQAEQDGVTFLSDGALEPEQVAESVIQGLADERFLILPHPEVAEFFKRKATDYDRWIRGMRKLQARVQPAAAWGLAGSATPWNFEQEPYGERPDETSFNLRAYFDRMPDEKMQRYSPAWSDEQVMEWDGNFTDEGSLFLICSERDVDIQEYRRELAECIRYRDRVRDQVGLAEGMMPISPDHP